MSYLALLMERRDVLQLFSYNSQEEMSTVRSCSCSRSVSFSLRCTLELSVQRSKHQDLSSIPRNSNLVGLGYGACINRFDLLSSWFSSEATFDKSLQLVPSQGPFQGIHDLRSPPCCFIPTSCVPLENLLLELLVYIYSLVYYIYHFPPFFIFLFLFSYCSSMRQIEF